MNGILERHSGVKALFDNRWLHLIAMDENGDLAWRYHRDLEWVPMTSSAEEHQTIAAE